MKASQLSPTQHPEFLPSISHRYVRKLFRVAPYSHRYLFNLSIYLWDLRGCTLKTPELVPSWWKVLQYSFYSTQTHRGRAPTFTATKAMWSLLSVVSEDRLCQSFRTSLYVPFSYSIFTFSSTFSPTLSYPIFCSPSSPSLAQIPFSLSSGVYT